MESKKDLATVAYKMIAEFGDQAAERMDSIVKEHVAAKDIEGAAFWGDVASTVRRLQAGISIAVADRPKGNR
jgi:hypothetical protein